MKWYTNETPFKTETADPKDAKTGTDNGNYVVIEQIAFAQPLTGKVELYWKDGTAEQLAIRLYFVIR